MHKLLSYKRNTDVPVNYQIPGSGDLNRNRIIATLNIDRSIFVKSRKEKELLRLAKLEFKLEELKK